MTRRVLLFALGAVVLLVLGFFGMRHLSGSPKAGELPRASPSAPAAPGATGSPGTSNPGASPEKGAVLSVTGVVGLVERQAEGKRWSRVSVGDRLGKHESIRTAENSRADLAVGPTAKIAVSPSTELSVQEITDLVHRFKLEHGRLSVQVERHGTRRVSIESPDGKVVAQTGEGRFAVQRSTGTIAVATETGAVDLSAGGSTVRIPGGQQAVVAPEQAPTVPDAIPKEVLLKIARHAEVSSEGTLRGRTSPGNRVFVDGKPVPVDGQGRFALSAEPRKQSVEVVTEDPLGRRHRETVALVEVESKAPVHEVKVNWDRKSELDLKWQKRTPSDAR
jgi:hypothetical protein